MSISSTQSDSATGSSSSFSDKFFKKASATRFFTQKQLGSTIRWSGRRPDNRLTVREGSSLIRKSPIPYQLFFGIALNMTNDAKKTSSKAETEQQLIERARTALSSCNWEIGECASQWTTRYAKGRGDADFGAQIGMSGDQIFQRRHVWEKFHDISTQYPSLSWSHFYVAVNWEDAEECLQWAEDEEQTVAGMRAWRRAARGEDLSQRSDDQLGENAGIDFVPETLSEVKSPTEFNPEYASAGAETQYGADANTATVMTGVNQKLEPGQDDYAPFRSDARGSGSKKGSKANATPKEPITPEKLLNRLVATLGRCNKLLGQIDVSSLKSESSELRTQFCEEVEKLNEIASKLQ